MDKHIVYQVLVRLFGNTRTELRPHGTKEENGCGTFSDITPAVLQELRKLGTTHVWYTGALDHATQTDYAAYGKPADHPALTKGKAGSPYAIRDYYDVAPDLATVPQNRMAEFDDLVARTHAASLKVILDFVPNHVARSYRPTHPQDTLGQHDDAQVAFSPENDFYYLPPFSLELPDSTHPPFEETPAKATGNDAFTHQPSLHDWYETVKLNYGTHYAVGQTPETPLSPTPLWHKMKEIVRFWAQKGVDGFRCDMAEMVPLSFWQWLFQEIKTEFPHLIFIAEVYDPRKTAQFLTAGFDYLYDKTGLYDRLRATLLHQSPATAIAAYLAESAPYAHRMLRFMENHDEVRLASPQFLGNARQALPAFLLTALAHRGPYMLYFGQELGEAASAATGFSSNDGKTSIFDYTTVPTVQAWLESLPNPAAELESLALRRVYEAVGQLAHLPAFAEGAFHDLTPYNTQTHKFAAEHLVGFLRIHGQTCWLVACNLHTQISHIAHVRIGSEHLAAAGISAQQPIRIEGVLPHPVPPREQPAEELTRRGIELHVGPSSFFVLKISPC